jgi:hypothetical protein
VRADCSKGLAVERSGGEADGGQVEGVPGS